MFRLLRFLSIFVLFFSVMLEAKAAQLESLSYEDSPSYFTPTYSRAIFNLSSAVSYDVFTLDADIPNAKQDRVVIDLDDTTLPENLAVPTADLLLFDNVRTAINEDGRLRIVIDLKQSATSKVIVLEPDSTGSGHRLFIDLFVNQ